MALGLDEFGEHGFRTTHRQAQRASLLAPTAEPSLTLYSDVAIEALAAENPEEARNFVSRELGAIDDESANSRRIRETLAAYFAAEHNAASAAASLGVHSKPSPIACAPPKSASGARSAPAGSSSSSPCDFGQPRRLGGHHQSRGVRATDAARTVSKYLRARRPAFRSIPVAGEHRCLQTVSCLMRAGGTAPFPVAALSPPFPGRYHIAQEFRAADALPVCVRRRSPVPRCLLPLST